MTDKPRIEQFDDATGERHVVVRPTFDGDGYEIFESRGVPLRTFATYEAAVADLEREGFHISEHRGMGDEGLAEDLADEE